jgi:hypothetical protein
VPRPWKEPAMWMLWILVPVVVVIVLGVLLQRRGSGDPDYRAEDLRNGPQLGGPSGQMGPGDGGGGF